MLREDNHSRMKISIYFCCAYLLFLSGAGFLFGQAFVGKFSIGATLAGTAGLVAGSLGVLAREWLRKRTPLTTLSCLVCLVGVGLDVQDYYANYNIEGNYYPWVSNGLYLLALSVLILGEVFRWRYPQKQSVPPPLPNGNALSDEPEN